MPERVTANRREEFLAALTKLGGSSGNRRLRAALGWEEDFYWKVQGRLVSQGVIIPGRGQGGSVRLTIAEAQYEDVPTPSEDEALIPTRKGAGRRKTVERQLYGPIHNNLATRWISRFGFDKVWVEETHSRGSKETGGTFTRPDITAVGARSYVYLPKRLEIITFEVKPEGAVGIMGVLEAIAHREAAHRSYVFYATSRAAFDEAAESERIFELAQKYGVGVVLTEKADQVETWEIALEAIRHEPDPSRLDRFIGDLPRQAMKDELHRFHN